MKRKTLWAKGWGLGATAQPAPVLASGGTGRPARPGAHERRRVRSGLVAVALWALAVCGLAADALAETVNRIIAIVNDEIITEADVASRVSALLEDREAIAPGDPDSAQVRRMMLRHLIEQRLLLQEATSLEIEVGPEEIAARLDEIRGKFVSEEEFTRMLSDSQLTKEQLKEEIRNQLMVQWLIDAKVRATVVVSPQEVAKELETHPELVKSGDRIRASHILIRVNENRPEEAARTVIANLRQRLVNGEAFPTLAKDHSEDPHQEEGGAMGWVAQGELLPELDAALFELSEGELSDPIQTRLGFHLVRVEERRTAASLSMTEANHSVYQQLYQEKFEEAMARWLTALKRRAYIEVISPEGR